MSNPDPQLYVCCGGPLWCPAAAEVKKSYIPFTISFAKAFFSCFLSPILLGFPEMPDFPKYRCRIKTRQKNSSQTILKGGSP